MTTNNKTYIITKHTVVTYTAYTDLLSGEVSKVFPVGATIVGANIVKDMVVTTPEGRAYDPNNLDQTMVQIPLANVRLAESGEENTQSKKPNLVMIGFGILGVFAVYYALKYAKVIK
jgi:hypothetical protein